MWREVILLSVVVEMLNPSNLFDLNIGWAIHHDEIVRQGDAWVGITAKPVAAATLKAVLAEFNFRNLDELEEFRGRNTTTEFMARVIFDRLAATIRAGRLGPGAQGLERLKVSLHESHVAWASYEGAL